MLSGSACRTVRSAAPAGRPGPLQRLAAPVSSRRGVVAHVEFSDAFRAALQTAIERDPGASSLSGGPGPAASSYGDSYSNSSRDAGYSRAPAAEAYRPVAAPVSSPSGPMMQILATALVQSRQTLERLQAEEAEIENLIQRERKQVERLEWLLEKVQQDYAYFDQLQKRFESQGSAANSSNSSSSSSSSAYDSYGSSSGGGGYVDSYGSSGGYGSGSSSGGYGGGGYDRSESPSNGSSSGGSRFANYY